MAGIEVVLIDATRNRRPRQSLFRRAAGQGDQPQEIDREKKAEVLARITATPDYAALAGCDLIVEAVFEDPAVKAEVTKKPKRPIPPRRSLPPTPRPCRSANLAKPAAPRTVHRHPLLQPGRQDDAGGNHQAANQTGDVRRGQGAGFRPPDPQDADRGQRRALLLRQPLHHPLHQRRHPHGGRRVEPALVENAAKLVGMPLGPLQLVDETSIDLGVKIAKATKAAMGKDYPDEAVDHVIFWMADQGRLGRKANAGFYAYSDKGERLDLWDGLAAKYPLDKAQPSLADVQHRLLFAQVLEAVRALEEDVLTDIREGDVGRHSGLGLRALVGRAVLMAGHAGRCPGGRDLPRPDGAVRPALPRARHCCAKWPTRAKPSTAASGARRRRPEQEP
jgi:3-hydroxyacyl-CoA dehydrogenase/enoyl-CoA hydratase/3-hydroxybutyryl-CoA epimerase